MFGDLFCVARCHDSGAVEPISGLVADWEEAAQIAAQSDAALKGLPARAAVLGIRLVPYVLGYAESEDGMPPAIANALEGTVCGLPWPEPGQEVADAVKALMHPGHIDWLVGVMSAAWGATEDAEEAEPMPVAEIAEAAG